MHEIPVVSMKDFHAGGERKARFIRDLGAAFRTYGFARVADHEIIPSWFEQLQNTGRQLLSRPQAELMSYHRTDINCQRGYVPHRIETAAGYKTPDEKVMWHFGRDSVMVNTWPPDELAHAFHRSCAQLFSALDHLYVDLMAAVEQFLQVPEGFLKRMVRGQNNSLLRVALYPKFKGDEPPGALRAQEHPDINMLTLLPTASSAGLELRTHEGVWIPVRAIPGEIIVNTGLMIERVTNRLLKAMWHRVVNPGNGVPNEDRVSTPFFGHPMENAVLEVLPQFTGPGFEDPQPPITALSYLEQVLSAIKLKA